MSKTSDDYFDLSGAVAAPTRGPAIRGGNIPARTIAPQMPPQQFAGPPAMPAAPPPSDGGGFADKLGPLLALALLGGVAWYATKGEGAATASSSAEEPDEIDEMNADSDDEEDADADDSEDEDDDEG